MNPELRQTRSHYKWLVTFGDIEFNRGTGNIPLYQLTLKLRCKDRNYTGVCLPNDGWNPNVHRETYYRGTFDLLLELKDVIKNHIKNIYPPDTILVDFNPEEESNNDVYLREHISDGQRIMNEVIRSRPSVPEESDREVYERNHITQNTITEHLIQTGQLESEEELREMLRGLQ